MEAQETLITPPDCTICLQTMEKELGALPCGHVFHRACIMQWFQSRNNGGQGGRASKKECPCCKRACAERNVISIHFEGAAPRVEPVVFGGGGAGYGGRGGAGGANDAIVLDGSNDDANVRQIRQLQETLRVANQRLGMAAVELKAVKDNYEYQLEELKEDVEDLREEGYDATQRLQQAIRQAAVRDREINHLTRRQQELIAEKRRLAERLTGKAEELAESEKRFDLFMASCGEGASASALLKPYTIEWVRSQVQLGPAGETKLRDTIIMFAKKYEDAKKELRDEQQTKEDLQGQVNRQRQQLLEFDAKVKELVQERKELVGERHAASLKRKQPGALPLSSSSSSSSSSSLSTAAPNGKKAAVKEVTTATRPLQPPPAPHQQQQRFVVRNAFGSNQQATSSSSSSSASLPRSFMNTTGGGGGGGAGLRGALSTDSGSFIKKGYDAMGQLRQFPTTKPSVLGGGAKVQRPGPRQ